MLTNQKNKIYDLEERTANFAEDIIEFAKKIPQNVITIPLINQLVKSGTSIGSNYCEADCAESRKDFEHKIGICKKESKESRYWLRIIIKVVPELRQDAINLWREVSELHLIFIAIIKKSKSNKIEQEIKHSLVIRN